MFIGVVSLTLADLSIALAQDILIAPSGILTNNPGYADGAVPARLNDGNTSTEWRSPYYTYRNDLEYKFDPNLSGISGLEGDNSDLFTLHSVTLRNWSNPYGLKNFQLYVITKDCDVVSSWTPVVASVASNSTFNFLLDANGGVITKNPGSADGAVVARLTDGSLNTEWRSPYYTYRNDLEYKFDPMLSGTSGLEGNNENLFTLSKFNLYNYPSVYGLKDFQVYVQTKTGSVLSPWTLVDASNSNNPAFNFLLDANGGVITKNPGSADGAVVARLTDGSLNTEWRSPYYTYRNDLEYKFDPMLSGTSGLEGNNENLFTLSKFNLYNYRAPYGVKDFQVYVQTKADGVISPWTLVKSSVSPNPDFNFLLDTNGATLTKNPGSADGAVASRLTDGSLNTEWRSPYNTYRNDLEYKFDPMLSGASGLEGNDENLFTLTKLNLYNYQSPYGLKDFQIYVQTKTGGVVSPWTVLDASTSGNPAFNFLLDSNGGVLTNNPGSADGAVATRLTDGSLNTEWRSPYNTYRNDLEYKFDPMLSGASGLEGNDENLFTLTKLNLYNYQSPYGLKDFQIYVQTKTGGVVSPWTLVSIGGSTTITASNATGEQSFAVDMPITNIVALRLRTLNNYGGNRTIIYEMEAVGDWAGKQTLFTAANSTGLQTFNLPVPVANLVALRLRTVNNYGGNRTIVYELEAPGNWTGTQSTFTAENVTGLQTITLPVPIDNVVALRLRTLNNRGADRIIIYEVEAPGNWSGKQTKFTAANVTGLQTFILPVPVADVAAFRLRTLSNYGGDRIIIYEIEAPANWSGKQTVFTAANTTGQQTFNLPIPVNNVAAFRLRTLSNYGSDRIIVYQMQALGDLGKICEGSGRGGGAIPNSFDCSEVGGAPATPLYTKLADNIFNLDVLAIASNGSVDTGYVGDINKNVTLELVDGSGAVACATRSVLSSEFTRIVSFNAGNKGRKTTSIGPTNFAYPDVRCRITDTNQSPSIVSCSTDNFSIRPTNFSVNASANADLSGLSTSATPVVKAGRNIQLTATGNVLGYSGTPKLDTTQLLAHSGAAQIGVLSGNFNRANPATAEAGNNNFNYSEVGYFALAANGVYDDDFTGVDSASGDCTPDFSNTLVAGQYGCKFGNTTQTDFFGRFIPDHLLAEVSNNGSFAHACSGFSYNGQPIRYANNNHPMLSVFAYNASTPAGLTKNYTGAFARLLPGQFAFTAPTRDALQKGVDNTNLVNVTTSLATPSLVDNTNGNLSLVLGEDEFTYQRESNALIAPFNNALDITLNSVVDSDGVAANNLPVALQPAGENIRYGRINLMNAFGSELLDLSVPMVAEYFNGKSFIANADDRCSVATISIADADTGDALQTADSCIWDDGGLSGSYRCTSTAPVGQSFLQGTSSGFIGSFNLNLKAPGKTGSLAINAAVAAWLQFNWQGSGNVNPAAVATFGIYKGNSKQIYLREVY